MRVSAPTGGKCRCGVPFDVGASVGIGVSVGVAVGLPGETSVVATGGIGVGGWTTLTPEQLPPRITTVADTHPSVPLTLTWNQLLSGILPITSPTALGVSCPTMPKFVPGPLRTLIDVPCAEATSH